MSPSAKAGPSQPHPRRKLRPPAPLAPEPARRTDTLPIKVLQGAGIRRTDTQRPGFGRDVVFVTRKTGMGALLARARKLLVDEGHSLDDWDSVDLAQGSLYLPPDASNSRYTRITLYALGAAIPHALVLLHALLDVLPYPTGPGGMWYEITTGSVSCTDEIAAEVAEEEFPGLGATEEDMPEMVERIKSSIRIDLHISPRRATVITVDKPARASEPAKKRDPSKKARPTAKKRRARARAKAEATGAEDDVGDDEEAMMNA